MKAILQAAELMTNSLGNVIVIIVAGLSVVDQVFFRRHLAAFGSARILC